MGHQYTILLAESNEDDALIIQDALRDAGVNALTFVVRDAQQATAYLQGKGKYGNRKECPLPHLVVVDMDFRLSGASEVLQWLHEHGDCCPNARVVVIGVEASYSVGVDEFFSKPFRYDEWVALVREWKRHLPE
ncbi:MAG TPA: hypothetical protein VIW67_22845 [Terriglobales bacterium]|jgi:CheY-like chemotaxis protein